MLGGHLHTAGCLSLIGTQYINNKITKCELNSIHRSQPITYESVITACCVLDTSCERRVIVYGQLNVDYTSNYTEFIAGRTRGDLPGHTPQDPYVQSHDNSTTTIET